TYAHVSHYNRPNHATTAQLHLSHPHVFFSTDTPPTEIYTLSLHDALPISPVRSDPTLGWPPAGWWERLLPRTPQLRLHPQHARSSSGIPRFHHTDNLADRCRRTIFFRSQRGAAHSCSDHRRRSRPSPAAGHCLPALLLGRLRGSSSGVSAPGSS